MPKTNSELKKKILEDIKKTGFVSELKTISLLIDKGWKTEHSETFEDKDENKSREIDVLASKVEYVKELGFRLTINLVIEVKKSDKHWIIFSSKRRIRGLGWRIMNRTYNTRMDGTTLFGPRIIDSKSPRETIELVGKAFHEFNKSPNEKSNIYGALISVSKAAMYFRDRFNDGKPLKNFAPEEETSVSIYLPVVVLDGLLFEVCTVNKGNIKLKEKDFIPTELSYSSPNYKNEMYASDLFPDIVTYKGLGTYLNTIEKWRLNMFLEMTESLKKVGKKPARWYLEFLEIAKKV